MACGLPAGVVFAVIAECVALQFADAALSRKTALSYGQRVVWWELRRNVTNSKGQRVLDQIEFITASNPVFEVWSRSCAFQL